MAGLASEATKSSSFEERIVALEQQGVLMKKLLTDISDDEEDQAVNDGYMLSLEETEDVSAASPQNIPQYLRKKSEGSLDLGKTEENVRTSLHDVTRRASFNQGQSDRKFQIDQIGKNDDDHLFMNGNKNVVDLHKMSMNRSESVKDLPEGPRTENDLLAETDEAYGDDFERDEYQNDDFELDAGPLVGETNDSKKAEQEDIAQDDQVCREISDLRQRMSISQQKPFEMPHTSETLIQQIAVLETEWVKLHGAGSTRYKICHYAIDEMARDLIMAIADSAVAIASRQRLEGTLSTRHSEWPRCGRLRKQELRNLELKIRKQEEMIQEMGKKSLRDAEFRERGRELLKIERYHRAQMEEEAQSLQRVREKRDQERAFLEATKIAQVEESRERIRKNRARWEEERQELQQYIRSRGGEEQKKITMGTFLDRNLRSESRNRPMDMDQMQGRWLPSQHMHLWFGQPLGGSATQERSQVGSRGKGQNLYTAELERATSKSQGKDKSVQLGEISKPYGVNVDIMGSAPKSLRAGTSKDPQREMQDEFAYRMTSHYHRLNESTSGRVGFSDLLKTMQLLGFEISDDALDKYGAKEADSVRLRLNEFLDVGFFLANSAQSPEMDGKQLKKSNVRRSRTVAQLRSEAGVHSVKRNVSSAVDFRSNSFRFPELELSRHLASLPRGTLSMDQEMEELVHEAEEIRRVRDQHSLNASQRLQREEGEQANPPPVLEVSGTVQSPSPSKDDDRLMGNEVIQHSDVAEKSKAEQQYKEDDLQIQTTVYSECSCAVKNLSVNDDSPASEMPVIIEPQPESESNTLITDCDAILQAESNDAKVRLESDRSTDVATNLPLPEESATIPQKRSVFAFKKPVRLEPPTKTALIETEKTSFSSSQTAGFPPTTAVDPPELVAESMPSIEGSSSFSPELPLPTNAEVFQPSGAVPVSNARSDVEASPRTETVDGAQDSTKHEMVQESLSIAKSESAERAPEPAASEASVAVPALMPRKRASRPF